MPISVACSGALPVLARPTLPDLAQGLGEVLDPVSKDEEADDVAVARFLRTCPGLSKAIIGDLLGQNTQRCLRVLDAFTHMFDFSGAPHSRQDLIACQSE
jgi:hypothetical protein